MALYRLNLVAPGVAAVAVHLKSHVGGDGPLGEGPDQGLAEALNDPFCGRRAQEPAAHAGEVEIRHFGVVGDVLEQSNSVAKIVG